jgi:hypothetical protein
MSKTPMANLTMLVGDNGSCSLVVAEQSDLPDNIEDGVDEEGMVDGHTVETYYREIIGVIPADGYLRVVADDGFTDIETRIPDAMLEAAGWHKDAR